MKQSDSAQKPSFSTSQYWSCTNCNLNTLTSTSATSINKAREYGTSLGGVGGLLTKEEIEQIAGQTFNWWGSIENSNVPSWIYNVEYWLGTVANEVGKIGDIYTNSSNKKTIDATSYSVSGYFVVRPTIEISKDLIN